jgi:hypothetical protein
LLAQFFFGRSIRMIAAADCGEKLVQLARGEDVASWGAQVRSTSMPLRRLRKALGIPFHILS